MAPAITAESLKGLIKSTEEQLEVTSLENEEATNEFNVLPQVRSNSNQAYRVAVDDLTGKISVYDDLVKSGEMSKQEHDAQVRNFVTERSRLTSVENHDAAEHVKRMRFLTNDINNRIRPRLRFLMGRLKQLGALLADVEPKTTVVLDESVVAKADGESPPVPDPSTVTGETLVASEPQAEAGTAQSAT